MTDRGALAIGRLVQLIAFLGSLFLALTGIGVLRARPLDAITEQQKDRRHAQSVRGWTFVLLGIVAAALIWAL